MIEVTGNSLQDIKEQLGIVPKEYPVYVEFRYSDYNRRNLKGCIVHTTKMSEGGTKALPREFLDTHEAVEYIRDLLMSRDAAVDQMNGTGE